MYYWIINVSLVFVLCVCITEMLITNILLVSYQKRLFDIPNERKVHHEVVSRLGGIAFVPTIIFSMALIFGINLIFKHQDFLLEFENNMSALCFWFCSSMSLYFVGAVDDLIGVRFITKFLVQIVCGILFVAGGLCINNLYGIMGIYDMSAWIAYPLTVLVVMLIVNAINLIDGIDGLASGLSGVALLFYGLIFMFIHQYVYAMIAFATLGVLIPFFYYNVFGGPKQTRKIFMGDVGSLTIGITLSLLSIILFNSANNTVFHPNSIVLAFAPLLIPCLDVMRVFIHRIRMKKSPFISDMNHIHHKLLALGMSKHKVMMTIVTASIIFTVCNVVLSCCVDVNILLISDILIYTIGNILLTNLINKRKKVLNDPKIRR
ncbi:MAG: MraY family glycosyltransferase [Bacteroidaceae bacterium]